MMKKDPDIWFSLVKLIVVLGLSWFMFLFAFGAVLGVVMGLLDNV